MNGFNFKIKLLGTRNTFSTKTAVSHCTELQASLRCPLFAFAAIIALSGCATNNSNSSSAEKRVEKRVEPKIVPQVDDPIAVVKEGLVRRVPATSMRNIAMATAQNEKPHIFIFTSTDRYCGPCRDNLPELKPFIEALNDQYEIILTTFEPWREVSKYPKIIETFKIRGVPSSVVVHKGRRFNVITGGLDISMADGFLSAVNGLKNGEYKGTEMN